MWQSVPLFSSYRVPRGRYRLAFSRSITLLALWGVVVLMAVPAVSSTGPAARPTGAPKPVHALGTAGLAAIHSVSAQIGPYRLTNGAQVNVGALAPYVLAAERSAAVHLSGTAVAGAWTVARTIAPKNLSSADRIVSMVPSARPVRPLIQGGVNGTVLDSVTDAAVSGANVTLVPVPTQPCGVVNCSPVPTNGLGQFTVYGPAGLAEIQITAPNYLENDTLVQVPSGRILDLGNVVLEHFAFVTGTVRGSDPSHEVIPSNEVSISTGSRNFTILGAYGSPNSTGQFTLEVPPVPDYVSFLPRHSTGPYLMNTTYVDPQPHQIVSLGTVFLPTGTAIQVVPVDRNTGRAIPNATYTVTACVLDSAACPFGPVTNVNATSPAPAYALPGPTFLKVAAFGYVANETVVGTVPAEPMNHSIAVTVELVPDAVLVFQTNVTGGGIPTSMAKLTYGLAQVCSLSSVQNGFFANTSVVPSLCTSGTSVGYRDFTPNQVLFIPPLRSEIEFLSHWVGLNPCPSIACKDHTLLFLPVYFNQTFVNATPGEVVNLGTLNSTPGGWINGSVAVAGTGRAPSLGFSVQVCSTAVAGWCDNATSAVNDSTEFYHDCPGQFNPTYFCAPSPPGPVLISVLAPGYAPNQTWANLPFECCNRLGPNSTGINLAAVTTDHSAVINVSGPGIGTVGGRVLVRLTNGTAEPLGGSSVEICPVLATSLDIGCNSTVADPNGSFSLPVLRGWENILGAAPEMTSNGTWVYVETSNTTGTIWLTQPAEAIGSVVTPAGVPVAGATVQICPASLPAVCRRLGTGFTSAGGAFSADYPGAAFPGDAYRIVADAAGYTEGAAWVNLTSGNLTYVGSIVLVPVGNGTAPGFGGERPGNASSTAPTWLDGAVIDNRTGMPLWGYFAQACPVLSLTQCTPLTSAISNPEFAGNFNASLPGGPSWVNVSEPGFATRSLYVNISGAVVHLGRIALDPLPRATGRVLFANWTNGTVAEGLAPNAAEVTLCDLSTGVCGLGMFPSGNGTFNVSGPSGPSDTLSFHGSLAILPVDVLGPGVGSVSESVDMPVQGTALPTQPGKVPELPLYSEVTGRIGDGSTANSTLHRAAEPLRYGSVNASIPKVVNLGAILTGNGSYTLFVPPGVNRTVTARGASYWTDSTTFTGAREPQGVQVVNMELGRFGWINVRIVAGSPPQGVSEAPITASVWDPTNNTYVQTIGFTDAVGYANVTAPPGSMVVVTATDPLTGQVQNTTVTVRPSRSTFVDFPVLSGGPSSVYWIASAEVNTVGVPIVTTVRDPVTGGPLGAASVQVDNFLGEPVTSGTSVTNQLGQFLLNAPVAVGESFSVSAPGYSPNGTSLPSVGEVVRYREINLTGDGVIEGMVVDAATGRPVDGATVSACMEAAAGLCTSVGTNASGDYWVSLPPGVVGLQYSAVGYVQNQSLQIQLCSDCFVVANGVVLWRDALLKGVVVDSVTGEPLGGASLTLCPVGSSEVAYCGNLGVPETTGPDGKFTLEPPMGAYVFNVTYPGYVPETIAMDLNVGELVDLGTIAMLPEGSVEGRVVSGLDQAPLANVTVVACAVESPLGCTDGVTDDSGSYVIQAPPGHYLLSAVAPGFGQGTATTNIGATQLTLAPVIVLPYDGPGGTFPVEGVVETMGPNATAIQGATVTAVGGGVLQGGALTGPDGGFGMDLVWGNYSLEVTAGGFGARRIGIIVHEAVTGLFVALPAFQWTVQGTARSVSSGIPAVAVPIYDGARLLNVTDTVGRFEFPLMNGSHLLMAGGLSGMGEVFAPLLFPIDVRGPVGAVDLSLMPNEVPVNLTALDENTGRLVGEVSFVVTGVPRAGGTENVSVGLNQGVWAATRLPLGNYSVMAEAPGYSAAFREIIVQGPPVTVNLTMDRILPGAEYHVPWSVIATAIGIGLVVAMGVVVLLERRRRRPRRLAGTLMPPPQPSGNPEGP